MHLPATAVPPGVPVPALGIDFGGTKIEAAVLDADGTVAWRRRVANPGSYDASIRSVADLVQAADHAAGAACSIGIGAPGSPSPRTGLMRNANSTFLNGRRFSHDLAAALHRPVRLANDANCLALSEAADGAAAGAATVFAMIIGTGVGGGIVIGGAHVDGAHGNAGEIGHLPLPWPTGVELDPPRCWCGLPGCVETYVSGIGFARAAGAEHGLDLSPPQIVAAARAGEPRAQAALAQYVDRLGRVLALVVNLLDPDVIVLGGGMSNVTELYARLPQIVGRHAFTDYWDGRIVPARWGDASGVRGAARLWATIPVEG